MGYSQIPTMAEATNKLNFPKVSKVILQNFSLYSLQPVITVDIPDGVFCLAGANGLGKSSFLSAVNFGITGRVSDPERKFESVEEYYRYSLNFSEDYFNGRITDEDREEAQITIHLLVGN